MVEQLEKNSEALGRNAIWNKTSKIHTLPQYFCVQYMRFYWKQGNEAAGTSAGKAKILRKVTYPKIMDVFEFASDELKQELLKGRALEIKNREREDDELLGGGKKEEEKKDDADFEMTDAALDKNLGDSVADKE